MLIFFHFSLIFSCFFPVLEIIFGLMSFQDSLICTAFALNGSLSLSCNLYKQFFSHLVFPPNINLSSINSAHVLLLIDHFCSSHAGIVIFPENQTVVIIVCQMFFLLISIQTFFCSHK